MKFIFAGHPLGLMMRFLLWSLECRRDCMFHTRPEKTAHSKLPMLNSIVVTMLNHEVMFYVLCSRKCLVMSYHATL